MSLPRRITAITQGPPVGGMNFRDPLADMEAVYSPWLLNCDCETRRIRVRNGWVRHAEITATGDTIILGLGTYGVKSSPASNYLFAYIQDTSGTNKIYDVSTSTPSLVHTAADDTADEAYAFAFNKRLGFAVEADFADCARVYDGSSWSSWGFTSGGSPIGGRVNVSYKGRIYIFSGTTMYYGGLSAVSGATVSVDLTDVFEESGSVAWASPISFSGGSGNALYLAFGNSAGEVLVYQGSYPGDATWSQLGRYRISRPLGWNSILQFRYSNDTWILTDTGVVSLRDVISKAADQAHDYATVSSLIDDFWVELVKNTDSNFWDRQPASACFWPEKNRVLILMPGAINRFGVYDSAKATIVSYNCLTKAWSVHWLGYVDSTRIGSMTYYKGNVYFYTDNVVMTLSSSVFKDEAYNSSSSFNQYPVQIHGAYSSFGDGYSNKRLHGLEAVLKTDFDGGGIGVRAVADFETRVSDISFTNLVDGYNTPYYSVGADGTYLQWQIEGNTDLDSADGFELYAMTSVVQGGGVR